VPCAGVALYSTCSTLMLELGGSGDACAICMVMLQ
jgi:hypothetical protein